MGSDIIEVRKAKWEAINQTEKTKEKVEKTMDIVKDGEAVPGEQGTTVSPVASTKAAPRKQRKQKG